MMLALTRCECGAMSFNVSHPLTDYAFAAGISLMFVV